MDRPVVKLRNRAAVVAAIVAVGAVLIWYIADLNWRIARLESITHILVVAQPGARLEDVEREVGWKARRGRTDLWPLPIANDQSIADFDSYQLPHFGGWFEFTLLLDKNDRVVTMHVRTYPNDWRPLKRGL